MKFLKKNNVYVYIYKINVKQILYTFNTHIECAARQLLSNFLCLFILFHNCNECYGNINCLNE